MPIITEPITVNTFNKMWISKAIFHFSGKGHILVTFNPYDGENILATKISRTIITDFDNISAQDPDFGAMITALIAECKRQANKQEGIVSIRVGAESPDNPVAVNIFFNKEDGGFDNYRIDNCFALSATDPVFAEVFQTAMIQLAKQAGFEYEA